MQTDPVCGMQVDETSAAGSSKYQGKDFFARAVAKSKSSKAQKAFVGAGGTEVVSSDQIDRVW